MPLNRLYKIDPFRHHYKQVGVNLIPKTLSDITRSFDNDCDNPYGFDDSDGPIVAVWKVYWLDTPYKEVTREQLVQLIQSEFRNEQIDVVATEYDIFQNPSNKEWVENFLKENNLKVI